LVSSQTASAQYSTNCRVADMDTRLSTSTRSHADPSNHLRVVGMATATGRRVQLPFQQEAAFSTSHGRVHCIEKSVLSAHFDWSWEGCAVRGRHRHDCGQDRAAGNGLWLQAYFGAHAWDNQRNSSNIAVCGYLARFGSGFKSVAG
jgi:hypothetical protein